MNRLTWVIIALFFLIQSFGLQRGWSEVIPRNESVGEPLYRPAGDGKADDYIGLQQIIFEACGAVPPAIPPNATKSPVHLASGTFRINQPLHLPCGNLDLGGAGLHSTVITPTYVGPALLVEPYGANTLPLTTSLVRGFGNALPLPGRSRTSTAFLALGDMIGPFGPAPINGLTAFSLDFFYKAGDTNGGQIIQLYPVPPGCNECTNTVGIVLNSGNTLKSTLSVGGKQYILNSTVPLPVGLVHEIELSYDGHTVRLFQDGSLTASHAATGPITGTDWDIAPLPDDASNGWPDQPNPRGTPALGVIDSIRFSNMARHTTNYTPPMSKFVADANTLLLINFINTRDPATGRNQDGFQQVEAFGNSSYYLPIRGGSSGYQVPRIHLHDFQTGGPIFVSWSWQSIFERIGIITPNNALEMASLNLYSGDFLSVTRDIVAGGSTPIGIEEGGADNESETDNVQVGGFKMVVGFLNVGNGGTIDIKPTVAGNSALRYPFMYSSTQFTLLFPFVDLEQKDEHWLGNLWASGEFAPSRVIQGQFTAANNAPFIVRQGGAPITVSESSFGGAAPEVFHYIANPTGPDIVENSQTSNGNNPPWTDAPGNLIVEPCSGTKALASGTATVVASCVTGGRPVLCYDMTDGGSSIKCAVTAGHIAMAGNGSDSISWEQR